MPGVIMPLLAAELNTATLPVPLVAVIAVWR
jgi:hypothetical protein